MEQHPIPQQISSYEFKLVGEMTLKQFLKAAAGIILAILINTTKLVIIIKWPLMLLSGGIGLLLAFVPFEDRPLETWVISFLKSIYSPTIYTYKKRNEDWLDLSGVKREEGKIETIQENANLFIKGNTNHGIESKYVGTKEDKGIMTAEVVNKQKAVKKEEKTVFTKKNDESKINNVNESEVVTARQVDPIKTENWRNDTVDLNLKREKLEATGKAVFGTIPMPDRPDIPNVVVGMATSNEGKIVDGVIVEIQDNHGNPVRVIKTNALGQFKISTPLANGRYLLIAEKEGYTFDRVNIDLDGKIVDPVRIIAHN